MKQARLRGEKDFCLVLGNRRSQAAEMVLPAGESEGSSDNRIQKSSLAWVIVRPAMFQERTPPGKLEVITDVRGMTLTRVSRAEVAAFLLDQLTDARYLRKAVFIGHR